MSKGKPVVGSRWVYKVEHGVHGSVDKYKVKFVAKGFSQVEGIDYKEMFSLVAQYSSIIMILALAAEMGWNIHQMDMMTSFLNGMVEEEIYMEQPKGFETLNKDNQVCLLKRALYELKEAPRALYTHIDSYLQGLGFTKSEADANLYYITVGGLPLILVL